MVVIGTTTIGHNKSIVIMIIVSIVIGDGLFGGARQCRSRCAKSTSGIIISYRTVRCQIGNCMGVEHNRRDIMGHCIFNFVFVLFYPFVRNLFSIFFSKYWKIIDANKNIPVDVINIQ